jgi:hypothetical protein
MQFGREPMFQGRRHSKPNAGTIAEIFRDSSISKTKSEARNHNGKVDGNEDLNEEDNRVTTPDCTEIDAIQVFILPTLDFAMLNADIGEKQFTMIDKPIRCLIDEALKVPGLPIECHHASWRDGDYHTQVCSTEERF